MTLKPPRLKPGDTISVLAPAGPIDPSEVRPGIELLLSKGFKVHPAPHLYDRQEYLAGDDSSRLDDFHSAIKDKKIKAIFCARGGYGTLRLLSRIQFHLIRKNPKIIVGYSDITSLLLSIFRKTGLVTFHGPMVKEYAKNQGDNLEELIRLVSSDRPCSFSLEHARVLKEGTAEGTLIGGNLSLLCHLAGTRHMPDPRGAILFLEDKGEPSYRIDRMLSHLRLCGFFRRITGIVAGRFEDCGENGRIDELLLEASDGLNIPVISGFPIGHGERNLTIPVGLPAVLDTGRMTLRLSESPVL